MVTLKDPQQSQLNDSTNDGLPEGESPRLSEDDMERVNRYLSSPIHTVDRQPFRPWLMMLGLVAVVGGLSLISLLISWLVLG